VSHIRVPNHVFVMNVAMIQPQNGYKYNQYYSALDSIFFEAKLTRPRPGRGQNARGQGQLVEAEVEAKILASRA